MKVEKTRATACSIILRGTGLMAHSPGGTASPGLVTLPMPLTTID